VINCRHLFPYKIEKGNGVFNPLTPNNSLCLVHMFDIPHRLCIIVDIFIYIRLKAF
jgi:hypothetical protein